MQSNIALPSHNVLCTIIEQIITPYSSSCFSIWFEEKLNISLNINIKGPICTDTVIQRVATLPCLLTMYIVQLLKKIITSSSSSCFTIGFEEKLDILLNINIKGPICTDTVIQRVANSDEV